MNNTVGWQDHKMEYAKILQESFTHQNLSNGVTQYWLEIEKQTRKVIEFNLAFNLTLVDLIFKGTKLF